jgi:hypothetical protein
MTPIKLLLLLILFFSTTSSFATERITVYGQRMTLNYASAFIGISWGSGEYNSATEDNSKPVGIDSDVCSRVNKKKPAGCSNSVNIDPNGCSSAGFGGDWDSIFNGACNGHDECYTSVGAVKGMCDSIFDGDLRSICDTEFNKNGSKRIACHGKATLYSGAVSIAPAFMYFNPAQADLKCVIWRKLKEKACSALF